MYCSEADMVADLRREAPRLWGAEANTKVEVRCHDRARMDVLVTTQTSLFAVEAKLSHWGRLLAQAFLHQYCVDYIYVAIPAHLVTPEKLIEAERYRIGVVGVDAGGTSIIQRAVRTPQVTHIRERLANCGIETVNVKESI